MSSSKIFKYTSLNNHMSKNIENECMICFNEIDTTSLLVLESLECCKRNCKCKGNMHSKCFHNWHSTKNTCPVCNKPIELHNPIIAFFKYLYKKLCCITNNSK